MNEYVTDRPVNSGQLAEEMGVGIRSISYDDGTTKVKAEVAQDILEAAVEAHIPDPDWSPPPTPPTEREIREARLLELTDKAVLTPQENAEYRKLVAQLMLGGRG